MSALFTMLSPEDAPDYVMKDLLGEWMRNHFSVTSKSYASLTFALTALEICTGGFFTLLQAPHIFTVAQQMSFLTKKVHLEQWFSTCSLCVCVGVSKGPFTGNLHMRDFCYNS